MTRMMNKALLLVVLLLTTSTDLSQVQLLKKPVLAPQGKSVIKPIQPIASNADLWAVQIARGQPNRTEAARRLKAQNIQVEAALAAIREVFGSASRQWHPSRCCQRAG